jgi:transposase
MSLCPFSPHSLCHWLSPISVRQSGFRLLPGSDPTQIVADKFHVIKQVNEELDRQRKQEKRQAELEKNKSKKAEILAGLNKSKHVLLKNKESLNESQLLKLEQVKLGSPILGIMHELKEGFRNIFEENTDWLSGLFSLGEWRSVGGGSFPRQTSLLNSAAQYFPSSQKTIKRWLDEIIAYFDNRTTSGVVEGINNKLKLIKRSAYGFRNFNSFRVRCLLCWHFNY